MKNLFIATREHSDGDNFYRRGDPRVVNNKDDQKKLGKLIVEWPEELGAVKSIEEAQDICDSIRAEAQVELNTELKEQAAKVAIERAEVAEKNARAVIEGADKAAKAAKEEAEKAAKEAEKAAKEAEKAAKDTKDKGAAPENKTVTLPGANE